MQINGKQIKNNTISQSKLDFVIAYTHIQNVALSVWNITHNLERYVHVTIYDDNNQVIEGEINYISNTQLQISFNESMTGTVIIS